MVLKGKSVAKRGLLSMPGWFSHEEGEEREAGEGGRAGGKKRDIWVCQGVWRRENDIWDFEGRLSGSSPLPLGVDQLPSGLRPRCAYERKLAPWACSCPSLTREGTHTNELRAETGL